MSGFTRARPPQRRRAVPAAPARAMGRARPGQDPAHAQQFAGGTAQAERGKR